MISVYCNMYSCNLKRGSLINKTLGEDNNSMLYQCSHWEIPSLTNTQKWGVHIVKWILVKNKKFCN